MYRISCHTRSLDHRKRNSQLHQNLWQFCDVKKKNPTEDTFHVQLKITDFDLRSLEVKGLHWLPANQAPKCSTCMELEHNKCFLWAGPVALTFLSSSDLLQSLAFWAFGGGEVRAAVSTSLPLPGVSELAGLFQTWLLMNWGWDQSWLQEGTGSGMCFTTGLYQSHRACKSQGFPKEDQTWMGI